jgi:hypothetical protein
MVGWRRRRGEVPECDGRRRDREEKTEGGWWWRERPVGYFEDPQRLDSHLGSERRLRCAGDYLWRLGTLLDAATTGAVLGNMYARIGSLEDSLTGACVAGVVINGSDG